MAAADHKLREKLLKPYFDQAKETFLSLTEGIANEAERTAARAALESLPAWFGGIRKFRGAPLEVLEQLLEHGFLRPEDRQNASPTVAAFLEFMRRFPQVTANGYAVEWKREDRRVAIDGLEVAKKDLTPALKQAWKKFGKTADEHTSLSLWWD